MSSIKEAKVAAQAAIDKAVKEFIDAYEAFIVNLTKVFGNPNNIEDPLNKAMLQLANIMTAIDQQERIILLATRWHAMVTGNDKNKEAFTNQNEAFFIANLEGPSVFSELGVPQIMNATQFRDNRDLFWAYVRKLSKKAAAVIEKTATDLPVDPSEFERDAQMAQTLQELGLMATHSKTGQVTLDIKKLFDPKNAANIMKRVMSGQKGQDPAVMKAALETVTSLMSGSKEGEEAFARMLSQG